MNNRLIRMMLLILALKCLASEAYKTAVAPSGPRNFDTFHEAAARLNAGEPLYLPFQGPSAKPQHVSSPLVPLLLRPLARLPVPTAFRIWVVLNMLMLVAAGALCCWALGLNVLKDAGPALLVLFTGFRYWPTVLELHMGNVDIVLLLAVSGMMICERHGKWMTMALLVALAALTKTWMLGAVFYLLARRKWREAFATGAFFAAGLGVLFSLVGWSEFPRWMAVTKRFSSQPEIVSHSVAGMARMYFTRNPVMTPLAESHVLHLLALAIGYGLIMAGLLYLWWRGPEMNGYQARLCLGLTALALVLGNSLAHQFYFVLALPLIWTLLTGTGDRTDGWRVRVAAFVLYLVFSVPTPGDPLPAAFTHGFKTIAVSITFVSGMLLWWLGIYALMREFPAYAGGRITFRAPVPARATNPVI